MSQLQNFIVATCTLKKITLNSKKCTLSETSYTIYYHKQGTVMQNQPGIITPWAPLDFCPVV